MKNKDYILGKYYKPFGTYLGPRVTHLVSKKEMHEHIFSTGIYDGWGAIKLVRIPFKDRNKI